MRIGIDASRASVARRTGTEHYARRLIQALLAAGSGHTFELYFREAPAPDLFPGAARRVIPFPRLWTHVRLSWELATRPRPDVLFVPAHVLPLVHPLPAVVTVHDLGYRHFPAAHPFMQRLYLEWSTRFSARAAARVIADSHATQQDLERCYGIPRQKIHVVHPGREEAFGRTDPAPVRARHGLPEDYLLFVGTLQPRKNLVRLVEAFERVRAGRPGLELVLAGRPGWLSGPILAAADRPGVRRLDYVPDEDLPGLYSGARAFVFPSLYEGFGFPVLEAMACGTPVICSRTSSLPEVAGEAALLVDPLDVREMAAAVERVLGEPALGAALSARGYARLPQFSWQRAARETLSVLELAVRPEGGA